METKPDYTELNYTGKGDTLLTYTKDGASGRVLFSDILPFWQYATEDDFEGGVAHTYGNLVLFSIKTAGGQGEVVVAWDTVQKRVVHISEGSYCVDFSLCGNRLLYSARCPILLLRRIWNCLKLDLVR